MTDKLFNKVQIYQGVSKLYIAASEGDFQTVRAMIKSGVDLNRRESAQSVTPIYGAIVSKNVWMIQELIRAGADLNVQSGVTAATPLLVGLMTGKVEVVKVLLDNGADIQGRIFKGNSALHWAADEGQVKISKLLIERGLDVNIRNEVNETPLHVAAKGGKSQVVQLLIAKGADVFVTCSLPQEGAKEVVWSNITPVFLAAQGGYADVVDILIQAGADVNVKTSENHTALHFPSQNGCLKVVNLLLQAGAGKSVNVKSNTLGVTPLLNAVNNGHIDIVEALLKVEGIDVDLTPDSMKTPLVLAVSSGCLQMTKLLIANGAQVNQRSIEMMTPLHIALTNGNYDVAEFLIEHGANVLLSDSNNLTPLHVACGKGGPVKILKTLVEKGGNIDAKYPGGKTLLQHAAQFDFVEVVKFLVDCGADYDARDEYNFVVLHHAAASNSARTVAYLVTKVSDIDRLSCSPASPLHLAAHEGCREVVEILCASGADVNAEGTIISPPLHVAAEKGHLEIAKALLKYKAIVNLKDKYAGCTPLFFAVKNNHLNLVTLLLDERADVNAENKCGVLPIHVAAKAENANIFRVLLAKGAYYDKKVRADDYSGTPLCFARRVKNAKIITILEIIRKLFSAVIKNNTDQIVHCVQAGAIVNARRADGHTALHYAVINYNSDAVKVLLAGGADVSLATNKGDSPLQMAIANSCIKIPEILLAHAKKFDFITYNSVVDARTKDGCTVLHVAAENNKLHIVRFLLANGAVYNAKNDSNKTPVELTTNEAVKSLLVSTEELFEAVKKDDGLEEVMRIVENSNVAVNARETDCGATPLHWSICKDHTDIANALLSSGADYCLVSNDGTTPLHVAVSEGNLEIVKELLHRIKSADTEKANAFINARTTSGTVALHVASNSEVVKSLLQVGAVFDIPNAEGKTALELIQNADVKGLLRKTHEMFEGVKKDVSTVMNKLNGLTTEEFKLVTSTRNAQGQSLVQVILANSHVKIAGELLKSIQIR